MQVVVRTLRILSLVGEGRPNGLSLTEIASELDLPLPTAHRILKLLVNEGMVYRDPHSRQHFPGAKLLALARPSSSAMMSEVAGPHVRALSRRFDETVFVTQLIGPRAICVALAESQRLLRITVDIGREMPLHAAASARVLLAYQDEAFVRSVLSGYEMTKFTDKTPTTVDEVLERLEQIRRRGYEVSADELDKNIWAAALPLRLHGEVTASLTITAPIELSEKEDLRTSMLDAARTTAGQLEDAAGHPVVA